VLSPRPEKIPYSVIFWLVKLLYCFVFSWLSSNRRLEPIQFFFERNVLVIKNFDDEMAPSLLESYLGFEKTNLLTENT
jgi:hypothetical protein